MEELSGAGIRPFIATEWHGDRPYSSFWRALQSTRSMLSARPAHILHSHSEFGDMAAVLLKAASKAAIIVRTVHNGYRREWRKRPLRRLFLTNFLYPLTFAAEIGVNRGIARNLNGRWIARLLQKQGIFIPNAIDLDRFREEEVDVVEKRAALRLPREAPVVGSVGRLVEGKGYETFLEAAAIVLKDIPEASFVLVGDGELADRLKLSAHRLGISEHVILSGPRSDVEDLMTCMDLFVSSSLWEGLSTVILEAMASGLPVVATDIPGNQEILQHRSNGWLVPPSHPEAMAGTIIEALRRPSVRQQYADQALRDVKAFSIGAVADEHEALYLRLAHHGGHGSSYGCNSTSNSPTSRT
jgi:glycosyltransferase involved in cell wall biosynthesis